MEIRVVVAGNRVTNDRGLVREWGIAGYGVIWKSELDVRADLDAGRLIPLLEDHVGPMLLLQLVFPPGRTFPRRVRVIADALVDSIQGEYEDCREWKPSGNR